MTKNIHFFYNNAVIAGVKKKKENEVVSLMLTCGEEVLNHL